MARAAGVAVGGEGEQEEEEEEERTRGVLIMPSLGYICS
jgi:hypothetical protein